MMAGKADIGRRWVPAAGVACLALVLAPIPGPVSPAHLEAQTRQSEGGTQMERTVWDGVYSEAQATRGLAEYEARCSSCHRGEADARTGVNVDARIRGEGFMKTWRGSTLDDLYTAIQTTMPPGDPAGLPERAYLDIVALILRANEFPPGRGDLTRDALPGIRIQGEEGPQPLPSFSLVELVGCLEAGPGGTWVLDRAAEPTRSRDTEPPSAADLEAASRAELGAGTFRLQNFSILGDDFDPESRRGHRMHAKGVLIRFPDGDRIQLTSMESVAADCVP